LGDDADAADAGLFDCVHDRGECAKGDILISADENGIVAGVADFLVELGGDLVDVDGVIAEEDALLLVDGDDETLFADFFHSARFWNTDIDTGLEYGCGDHENDEEDEDDVDERSDVDVG